MRLFFAINLPEKIKSELNKINQDLKQKLPKAKWVEKQNIHLTVKFLGEINDNDLPRLINSAENIVKRAEGFSVDLNSFNLYPPTHPRIVYITLQSPQLISFAKDFITRIDKLDFIKTEHRGFLAHITLARIKNKFESEHFDLVQKTKYHNGFIVKSLDLMSSELTSQGPIYEIVKSFEL